mmetsp:Transcript_24980/g.59385  ORF Transcript_24980/g.59385 Transcript_24980/m.59385 type:complete len:81 (+) Transcript_24980:2314-2556(+)
MTPNYCMMMMNMMIIDLICVSGKSKGGGKDNMKKKEQEWEGRKNKLVPRTVADCFQFFPYTTDIKSTAATTQPTTSNSAF